MNILLEIADRDIILAILIFLALCLLGLIIFHIVGKGGKSQVFYEDDVVEEEKNVQLTEEQQKAKAELERVFNQMSADLEAKTPEPKEIEDFERMQEENAIISYQELIRQASEKEPINSIVEKEPIVKTIEEEYPVQSQLEMELEDDIDEPKKFKNSEIISPIFGIQNSKNYQAPKVEYKKPKPEYKQTEEKPLMAKHAYDEIKKNYDDDNNRDFLNSLKEFRRNL